ncbi:MAG: hypothetical protein ACREQM_11440 [Candidatus Dormibacteraceae bacterium]
MSRPVALLATGRSTFVQEAGRSMHRRARATLASLDAEVQGPDDLVETSSEVEAAGFAPDGRLGILLCATFADASVAEAAFGASKDPVLLWAVRDPAPRGERLYLNSLCGANLAAHALVRRGVPVRLIYGNPEEAGVRDALARVLRREPYSATTRSARPCGAMAPAAEVEKSLDELRGQTIGLIGESPIGFTTCEYDPTWLQDALGIRVHRLPLRRAFELIESAPVERRQAELKAATADAPSLRELPPRQVETYAATTCALGDWARQEDLAGLALRCWPEFPLELGACPCSALGRLAERGVQTACEADVNGAATMLLLRQLGARDTYLADVVRVDETADTATFWHCGLAPMSLAADPERARQDVHCNRGVGVAGNFQLRPGPVTIARIGWSGAHRMFLTAGEALPGPNRFKGNSIDVRLEGGSMRVVRTLIESGFEHHTVLAWAELRPQLRRAAQLLGMDLVEV